MRKVWKPKRTGKLRCSMSLGPARNFTTRLNRRNPFKQPTTTLPSPLHALPRLEIPFLLNRFPSYRRGRRSTAQRKTFTTRVNPFIRPCSLEAEASASLEPSEAFGGPASLLLSTVFLPPGRGRQKGKNGRGGKERGRRIDG